ncbi:histidine kinase dimerization/phospho-acceptor domain-containing protein [Acetonema longum]|uniref:histidine kinase n=1 Tax=Acetonema longum DSM 6540 TaxID=1009370 RepID=F7NIC8_9FIRM|nr:histidine kinase dimerization/phospho-acceptor domain-containing protein [Acetonema longum]EGO64212.1 hypothetical protein ALO_09144 [Acetonema longum DSM 6540]
MITRSLFFRQLLSHVAIILFMALTLSGSVMYYAYQHGKLDAHIKKIAVFFAEELKAGHIPSRTQATAKDEIGTLGKTFNAMADALFHIQQVRRNFISNISHELKTPLSCIKATTEALIDGIAVNDQERAHYLERILAETDRMSRLVHDIIDMEQLESGKMFIKQERLDADTIEVLLKKKIFLFCCESRRISVTFWVTPTGLHRSWIIC